MPAKKAISGERILGAALKIVEKRGMEGLNMRSLAKECNCSTQPIYLCFGNSENLKAEVGKRIFSVYLSYRKAETARGEYPAYKAAGMAYIRFAKEKSQYFKYLFMRNRADEKDGEAEADFDGTASAVSETYGLGGDKAKILHTHMWIWVHGIAAMCATGYFVWDMETVSRMLSEEFFAVKQRLDKI